ncbi:hypothetical protein H4R99_000090 [Coemansia sp. RSA 1722]|nr:hypothetical protein LPJ57_003210 [Coemansia sp. RSA 486]KAJ2238407.1 hypothetical protein IWW45_000027 [Coemansia sp. RSA 485]KAJ2606917.1 hypothetical protein H4R99_000090 [Coemansia sp. RSA 1722]
MPASDTQMYEELETQLAQLGRDMDAVEKDIQELGEFDGSRVEHRRICDSLRDEQRALERQLERLQLDIDGLAPETPALVARLQPPVDLLTKRLISMQRRFRASVLKYRDNLHGNAKREREMLLSGAATPAELRKRKVRTGNAVANAAVDLTTALQQTVGMMEEEIEKSVANMGALDESSGLLRKTKNEYGVMDNVLDRSRELIGLLEKADKVDRWLVLVGLLVFAAVAFNIVRKRVWIPGLSTLFGLLRYLLFGWSAAKHGAPHESVAAVVAVSATSLSLALSLAASSVTSAVSLTTSLAAPDIPVVTSTSWADEQTQVTAVVESLTAGMDSDLLSHADGVLTDEAASEDVHTKDDSQIVSLEEQPLPVSETADIDEPAPDNENEPVPQPQPKAETSRHKIQLPKPDPKHPRTYTPPVERPVREEL